MRSGQNFTYAGMVLASALMAGLQPDGHADMVVAAKQLNLAELLPASATPRPEPEPRPMKGWPESPVRH